MPKPTVELPVGPLRDLLAWWRKSRVEGLIIGGLAVAFLVRPRVTQDVDAIVLLDESSWPSFLKAGEKFSFESRIPDPIAFAHTNRVLLLRHRNSEIDVDLSLGSLPFELEAVRRGQKVKFRHLSVPVPTPEDLIVMKVVADRRKDRADILELLSSFSELDYDYIRKHVDAFAQVLESPELYQDLDRMLREHREEHRRKKK